MLKYCKKTAKRRASPPGAPQWNSLGRFWIPRQPERPGAAGQGLEEQRIRAADQREDDETRTWPSIAAST
eukprot:2971324-Pyramimonas_sp.AAC.1